MASALLLLFSWAARANARPDNRLFNRPFRCQYSPMLGWSARFFLSRAQRNLFARGVPVLMYHKIAAPPATTTDPFLYVAPDRFDEQMAAIRAAGFAAANPASALTTSDNRARRIVLTFDDGYRNVLDNAAPILARHRLTAIQFLVSQFIGRRNEWDAAKRDTMEPLMDEVQVREWLAAGHEIGSHSATHRNLGVLGEAEAREEIVSSKKQLEDAFGIPIRHFCYPYGGMNRRVCDQVGEAGYETACTVEFGVNTAITPRFELRRVIPLSSGEWLRKLIHRLKQKITGPCRAAD